MSIKKILLFSSLLTMNKDLNGTNLNKTSQNQNISLGIREDISFLDTIKLFLINDKYCQIVNLLSKENQKNIKEDMDKIKSDNKENDFFTNFVKNNKKNHIKADFAGLVSMFGEVLAGNKDLETEINDFTTGLTDPNSNDKTFKNTKFKMSDKEINLVSTDDTIKIKITNSGISVENNNRNKTSILSFSKTEKTAKEIEAIQKRIESENLNVEIPENVKKVLKKLGLEESSEKTLGFYKKHEGKFAIGGAASGLLVSLTGIYYIGKKIKKKFLTKKVKKTTEIAPELAKLEIKTVSETTEIKTDSN